MAKTNLPTKTLRPGFLVSVKTSVTGNVRYSSRDIEREHEIEGGAKKAVWQTERTTEDPEQHERAVAVRSKARSLVRNVCAESAFGLLCPENRADDLKTAIDEARRIVAEFNEDATLSRVSFDVLAGRIAQDDVDAVRAIAGEVSDLIEAMERGVLNCDVKVIRDAATRAKSVGQMLSVEAAARVQVAVEAARAAAKKIVAAGEQAAQEVDRGAIKLLTEARTSFLDLDDAVEVQAPAAAGRAIDLDPSVAAASAEYVEDQRRQRAAALDLDAAPVAPARAARAADLDILSE